MNIYWYWPFPAQGENALALATLRTGDRLTLHSLATRFGVPVQAHVQRYQAVRDLPEAPSSVGGTARWLLSRMATSAKRSRLRSRVVTRHAYDVCHIHSLNHFIDPWALTHLARYTSLISTVHDVVPHDFQLGEKVERRLLSRLYRNAGVLVVAHERLKHQLVTEFRVNAGRVEVIPLPILEPDGPWGVPPDSPIVLFFGSFRPNKGIQVLLEAIQDLSHLRGVRFHFAGRGSASIEQSVREAARRDSRISGEIGFVSNDRRAALFGRASLVVLPYTSFASQSGVLQDAYRFRVPVVVSDIGALGDSVREDRTGWTVPPGDSDALAAALVEALDKEEYRAQARDAADQIARMRSVEAIGRQLRILYQRVIPVGAESPRANTFGFGLAGRTHNVASDGEPSGE